MGSRRWTGAAAAACAVLLAAGAASAAEFEFVVKNQRAQTDGDPPTLVLTAKEGIASGEVILKSATGPNERVKLGRMGPGSERAIPLRVKRGEHKYTATIVSEADSGTRSEIPLEFSVQRVEGLSIAIDPDRVDTGLGTIGFRANRPIERVELELKDKSGRTIGATEIPFAGRYGELEVKFTPTESLGAIAMKAHDVDGFWTSVLLEPWWIEIEHEEIIFDFGKDTWQPSEEPKLEKSLAEIRKAMVENERHRPQMRLYVAGYTDTVGSPSKNQALSQKRARAIARWFRANGLTMPLFAQGFGESVLAVQTPDETANEKNRRALYVLGNAAPPRSASLPKASWAAVR